MDEHVISVITMIFQHKIVHYSRKKNRVRTLTNSYRVLSEIILRVNRPVLLADLTYLQKNKKSFKFKLIL